MSKAPRSSAPRSSGRACVTFGDVTAEMKLYPSAVSEGVSFVQVHGACGNRVKQQLYCEHDNMIVPREALVRAYELEDKQLVRFSDADLAELESPRTDELELLEFVPSSAVDHVFVAKTYYLGPDAGAERAYRLVFAALDDQDAVAIGRYYSKGKDRLVMVRPHRGGLALHYLHDADEVRPFEGIDLGARERLADTECDLMRSIVGARWSSEFHPEKYRDGYPDRVRAAAAAKAAGGEVAARGAAPKRVVVDLVEALRKTVADGPGKRSLRPKLPPKNGPASVRALHVRAVSNDDEPQSERMGSR